MNNFQSVSSGSGMLKNSYDSKADKKAISDRLRKIAEEKPLSQDKKENKDVKPNARTKS